MSRLAHAFVLFVLLAAGCTDRSLDAGGRRFDFATSGSFDLGGTPVPDLATSTNGCTTDDHWAGDDVSVYAFNQDPSPESGFT